MKVKVLKDSNELGKEAAMFSAKSINKAVAEKGKARIVLSTGVSQFDTLKYLVKMNVDWQKVEIFHLDEYVGLPEDHPASFRKYLKERFVDIVHPGKIFFINGEDGFEKYIRILTQNIREEPIDLALVGIGENGHIAFNDPPADFETKEAYWERFCHAIGKESLIFDDCFCTNDLRSLNYDQLQPIITEWSERITIKEILNILEKVGVPVGEANAVDKILEDPNIKLREMIIELQHPRAGAVKIANTPLRLSETPAKIETASPLFGQHTDELLNDLLGYTQEKISELRASEII